MQPNSVRLIRFKPDHIKIEKNGSWWQSVCLMFAEVFYYMPTRIAEVLKFPILNFIVSLCAIVVASVMFVLSRLVLLLAGFLGYLSYEEGCEPGDSANSTISDSAD